MNAQYNEAAVVEMIIRVLPDLAGKISGPLSRTEKMVIINSGNGVGGGASKLTGDITQVLAQLPPFIESLTGINLGKLIQTVPVLKESSTSPEVGDVSDTKSAKPPVQRLKP
jgi:flotillin